MLELVQQESSGASPFRDLYGEDEHGLHHVAVMVDDMAVAVRHLKKRTSRGSQRQSRSPASSLLSDATASLGHYIEVYEAGDAVKGFYEYVESLSKQPWDTQQPFVSG